MVLTRIWPALLLASAVGNLRINVTAFKIWEIPQQIHADNFPIETHSVVTSDGYILELHRIPHGRGQDPRINRTPVLLMHGLMSASNAFVHIGPEHALAYNLADAGFDVWLGNARGNGVSRAHVTLNPDKTDEKFNFFDFSWEEIALRDLPAIIDYILNHTNKEQLHYIGHSQGGTVFLVLNSMTPEYNNKIASAHLLGCVGYQEHFPDSKVKSMALMTDVIYRLATTFGYVEINPPNSDTDPTNNLCHEKDGKGYICQLMNATQLLRSNSDPTYEHASASVKQLAHYGQNIRDKSFRRWSYGSEEDDLKIYGDENPPTYNLNFITADVTLHYTLNDHLSDVRDVLAMANDMVNARTRKIARENFTHSDFVSAYDAKELVTEYIIEALRNVSISSNSASVKNITYVDTYGKKDIENGLPTINNSFNTEEDNVIDKPDAKKLSNSSVHTSEVTNTDSNGNNIYTIDGYVTTNQLDTNQINLSHDDEKVDLDNSIENSARQIILSRFFIIFVFVINFNLFLLH